MTYNQTQNNMNMTSLEYLDWRLKQSACQQVWSELKQLMIDDGCEDYEHLPIRCRNEVLKIDMIWGEDGAMGTIVADIADGDYEVEGATDGAGKKVFLTVKDKKIDEKEFHLCSAYYDWSITTNPHYYYECVHFNEVKKTVGFCMGS